MKIQMVQYIMLVIFIMETYVLKIKSTGHLFQFFLALIIFDIFR